MFSKPRKQAASSSKESSRDSSVEIDDIFNSPHIPVYMKTLQKIAQCQMACTNPDATKQDIESARHELKQELLHFSDTEKAEAERLTKIHMDQEKMSQELKRLQKAQDSENSPADFEVFPTIEVLDVVTFQKLQARNPNLQRPSHHVLESLQTNYMSMWQDDSYIHRLPLEPSRYRV